MCGIVGFASNEKDKQTIIKKMADKIAHRGPDEEGYYVDDTVALGHRRLSIIDLKSGGQPMFNEDKSMVIIFNGEIYNFQELKKELIEKGHVFSTNCDTEVILHGYEEYKEEILQKLRGMYTFAIYDIKEKTLFGARDIFGIKPLYYTRMNNIFMFASEIKAFLPHPAFCKELNKQALKTYLTFQYNPLEETFLKNVYKLQPGHYFMYQNNQLLVRKYFDITFTPKRSMEEAKLIEETAKCIEESVQSHRISDVKVGAFLSSGIDSSYIVSILKPNETFTVGFENKGFDETTEAKDLSDLLNIENKSKLITPDEFFEALPKVQYYSDEPHANLSSVPLYFLSALARKEVTVVLSGEGADELFGGYETYPESPILQVYRWLPKFIRKMIGSIAKKLPNVKGKSFFIKGSMDISEYYLGQAKVFSDDEANAILTKEYQNDLKSTDITKPYFDKVKGLDDVTRKQYVDMFLWLPNDILLKGDKMSMANSLEVRVPYLDKEVYNLAKNISKKYKIKGELSKYALRMAAASKIPSEWFKRHKKGFLVPFRKYIKEEKYYNIIKKEFESDYVKEFFDTKQLLDMLDKNYKGEIDAGRKIYNVYAFLLWYKEYFIYNS